MNRTAEGVLCILMVFVSIFRLFIGYVAVHLLFVIRNSQSCGGARCFAYSNFPRLPSRLVQNFTSELSTIRSTQSLKQKEIWKHYTHHLLPPQQATSCLQQRVILFILRLTVIEMVSERPGSATLTSALLPLLVKA